ncbi:hypothetical protein [Xanthomonas bromi]|uniref:Uncharacterized protein n=1 Tax=Xanthomonas bromi TaxID=56449 RepID=A0ABX5BYT7_9XANT|nr:hypothetical protein [Xanthomonas bromi]PPV08961.1 hypothetical protein XbrCFBP1976_00750 [Xanthomonas bromi]
MLVVWSQACADMATAQAQAKQIRSWPHAWQRRLVAMLNPGWIELYADACGFPIYILPVLGEHRASLHYMHVSMPTYPF